MSKHYLPELSLIFTYDPFTVHICSKDGFRLDDLLTDEAVSSWVLVMSIKQKSPGQNLF
jgi:hypothetical protein